MISYSNRSNRATPAIRAYLGGSFDPVHDAHIQMAMQVYDTFAPIAIEQNRELQVSLLPNARSPFKQQSTDPKHRLAMLKLAITNTPLHIDELELWQTPPVYTIDSVRELRQRYPHDSLLFIMGMDSVRSLNKWKDGLELINYVNLWAFDRHANQAVEYRAKPHTDYLVDEIPHELQAKITQSATDLLLHNPQTSYAPLKSELKGRIYLDPRTIATVSSTEIRHQINAHTSTVYTDAKADIAQNNLPKHLNPAVYRYIVQHKLYSAD